MKKIISLLLSLLLLIGICGIVPVFSAPEDDMILDKLDNRLKEYLIMYLYDTNKDKEISVAELNAMGSLIFPHYDIRSIDGLQYYNRRAGIHIDMQSNYISDLTPIAGFTDIMSLDISRNNIRELSALSSLEKCINIDLSENGITDLSPLANLNSCRYLNISENCIDLSEGSVNLQIIENLRERGCVVEIGTQFPASEEEIINFPDENLKNELLWPYDENGDREISIREIKNITFLALYYSEISSIEGLQYATNATSLQLNGNNVTDLSPISGLTQLTTLSIEDNQISDLTPISGLINLTSLTCSNNNITEINPITGLQNLKNLDLSRNPIQDMSNISSLNNVEYLKLNNLQLCDLTPLDGFNNLIHLELSFNQISDFSPLEGKSFQHLDLSHNNISDLTSLYDIDLRAITDGERIDLSYNNISDLTPLGKFERIDVLYLSHNQIINISPLEGLSFHALFLDYNYVENISSLEEITFQSYIYTLVCSLNYNYIDISEGSDSMQIINRIKEKYKGIALSYEFQRKEFSRFSDSETGIRVEDMVAGAIPRGSELSVNPVTDGENFRIMEQTSANFMLYDIKLTKDGSEVQPAGKITIKIPIPADFDRSKLKVFHIDSDGTQNEISYNISYNYAVIEVEHLSLYAIADVDAFEVSDIEIQYGDELNFTALADGDSEGFTYYFYIYGNGRVYYSSGKTDKNAFSWVPESSGNYNVAAYCRNNDGKMVKCVKQFNVE